MPQNGYLGEKYTAELLIKKGYTIVAQNFRSRYGEIDIIAENDRYIVFVEVKTRAANYISRPAEAVTAQKQQKIIKTAQLYLLKSQTQLQPRFDVVEVITASKNDFRVLETQHIENAFGV